MYSHLFGIIWFMRAPLGGVNCIWLFACDKIKIEASLSWWRPKVQQANYGVWFILHVSPFSLADLIELLTNTQGSFKLIDSYWFLISDPILQFEYYVKGYIYLCTRATWEMVFNSERE